jgi:integrase/recombinase XerD
VKDFLNLCNKKRLDVTSIKAPQMFKLVDYIALDRTKRSTNAYLSAVSSFYNYLLSYGYIDINPITKGHFLKEDPEEKKALSKEDQEIFKAYILKGEEKQKHSFLLMLYGGLRVSEIITVRKVRFENNILMLDVLGKGNKKRTVFIDDYPDTMSLLELFNKGYTLDLKQASLKNTITNISRKLKIKMTCHTLRHTYATNKASEGIPITVLQALLGHSNIAVTSKYVHIQDDTILNYFSNRSR